MGKLRFRERKKHAPGYTLSQQWDWNSIPGLLVPRTESFSVASWRFSGGPHPGCYLEAKRAGQAPDRTPLCPAPTIGFYAYFTEEKTKVQRGEVMWPGGHPRALCL